MTTGDWLNAVVQSAHLVSVLGWLTMLAMLVAFSWQICSVRDEGLRLKLQALRRSLLRPLWGAIGLVLATGIYNQYRNVPFPLPHPWDLQDVAVPYGRAYVLVLVGKQLFVAQMTLALVMVTWRLTATRSASRATSAAASSRRPNPVLLHDAGLGGPVAQERYTAIIATLALVSGVCILIAAAFLGYIHILAHGHAE